MIIFFIILYNKYCRERQKRIEKVTIFSEEKRTEDAEKLRASTAVYDKELHKRLIKVCIQVA